MFAPYQWVAVDQGGARRGRLEGDHRGARGRHRRHLPARRRDAHRPDRRDRARDRVDDLHLRGADEGRAGLVHPALRPRGQPRQHPARRGHPARDAAARPARRHAEGGALGLGRTPERAAELCPSGSTDESMSAEDVLRWACRASSATRLCLTCSWQKQSLGARAHGLRARPADRRDRARHAAASSARRYETRDRLVERYGLNLIQPEIITVAEQHRQEGPNLWERDPDRCCHIRKVEPLEQALEPYGAWISGIRRDQSPSRAKRRRSSGRSATASGSSTRSPTGTRSASGPTSRSTRFPTTRCTTTATVDRLHSLHPPGTRPSEEERAGRWARLGQARVRHPRSTLNGRTRQ